MSAHPARAEAFMRRALDEAAKGVGRTAPNPVVGAVVVKAGKVIATGFHARAGLPHAEVMALRAAGTKAKGADLYVTLEPCDHYGRTPPCSLAVLEAGIRRVICASADPFPQVDGKGVARLRKAGVEVTTGVLAAEADALNRPYFHRLKTGLPYVTLKAALTLDGKLATGNGDSQWVSGEASRAFVHRFRDQVDAILVGSQTALKDDPLLTTRLPGKEGRDAGRIVVDSHLRLPSRLKLFQLKSSAPTVVATLLPPEGRKARALLAQGVRLWTLPARKGRVDLKALLQRVAAEGWNHLLVEGGAALHASFLREKRAQALMLFLAPKLVGHEGLTWSGPLGIRKMSQALPLTGMQVTPVGEDVLVQALL